MSCMQRKIKLNCVSLVLALNLVVVCEAAELFYRMQPSTDTNWHTAGNWFTNDGGDYVLHTDNSGLPGTVDNVVLTGGNNFVPSGQTVTVQENTTAVASGGQFSLGRWGGVDLRINTGAELTVGGMSVNNSTNNFDPTSTIVNYGTFKSTENTYVYDTFNLTNHSGASFTSRGFNVGGTATITNSGTMDFRAADGSPDDKWLYLATDTGNNTWNMNAGTITADRIVMADGGAATLNLNGGAIIAEEIAFREDAKYIINVGDGRLEVDGDEQWILNQMKGAGYLRSTQQGHVVSVTYYGTDTDSSSDYYLKTVVELAAIPESAHVTLVMGLFALLYLPLSARKVAI